VSDELPAVSRRFWVGLAWGLALEACAIGIGVGLYALLRAIFEAVP